MIDDISLSTAIINNPQMKVEFNTNAQSTRLNRMGDWMFHYSGGRRQEAGVTHVQLRGTQAVDDARCFTWALPKTALATQSISRYFLLVPVSSS